MFSTLEMSIIAMIGTQEIIILALVILLLCRKKLFRNMFVKLFIDVFYDKDE